MMMGHRGKGVALATLMAAAALLGLSTAPSRAGLFSWLGGSNDGPVDPDGYQGPGIPFFGRGGLFNGGGQRGGGGQSQQPGSQAFHGDELPPEEGTPETRAWIVNPPLGSPTLSTRNIQPTKAAIQRYQTIVAQGGWPSVPEVSMGPGSTGQAVEILHRRLEMSGDLVGRSIPNEYDATLVQAVKHFQARLGIPPTGVLDNRVTIDALNVPANVRLQQLQANLSRLQSLSTTAGPRFVMVNIPAAQVEAVENGQVASRHAAVVGKVERPTPELSSKVQDIVINPYWYVPKSIIDKDLVPKARELAANGENLLTVYHMEAFDQSGQPLNPQQINWNGDEVYNYSYRQLPWEENSLGQLKINFPNKDSVYMHDTPLKSLFGRNVRFESSGCVRVHDIESLAAWLLRNEPGWGLDHIQAVEKSGEQVDVKLTKPIPVYFVYISAWATPDGTVNFRPDIYNHDGAPETASAY